MRRLIAKSGIKNKIVAFEDSVAAIDYLERESVNPRRHHFVRKFPTAPGVGLLLADLPTVDDA